MTLLLDTHVVLWAITGDPTLGTEFLDRLRHEPDIFLSPVSLGRSPSNRVRRNSPDPLTLQSG
ncbi:hypothetical protein Vlu01_17410 [Micromonospora lutea]|uniref:PIN domain-containing protein n=1 Tax=Micromonospora lutea TaxID=419825 RepID=A0ABQ4IT67_9ACTN|nr:hypothetical protein Vlu01_17410 [Micromonospora lutea]